MTLTAVMVALNLAMLAHLVFFVLPRVALAQELTARLSSGELSIQTGDVIVVKAKGILAPAASEYIESVLRRKFPATEILWLYDGTDIAVARRKGGGA